VIPEGEYGGGTVMVWDSGVYAPENTENVSKALAKGELKFVVLGKKLKGSFVLVRTRERQWLLMKHKDEYAIEGEEITETQPYSILTKRTLAEIAEDEGGVIIRKSFRRVAASNDERKARRKKFGTARRGRVIFPIPLGEGLHCVDKNTFLRETSRVIVSRLSSPILFRT